MKKHLSRYIRKPESHLKFLVLFILLTSSITRVIAQQTNQVTAGGIWYLEYLPADYNSNTNKYPVIFFLHGLGERGDTETSLANVAKNGPPKYTKNGQKFPFILISPQLKAKYTGWPNTYIDAVIEFVRSNPKYRIDESRMYLTGLSLGGGGTWGYIQDPVLGAKIAASVICCGHQNNTGKACNIVNNGIPVWGFHGDADGTVSVNKTINMIKALNACVPTPNPKALITIYPGIGHNCWDKAYEPKTPLPDATQYSSNVYDWMLQFKNGGLVVNAGADVVLNSPANSTTITATASLTPGTVTSYTWTKQSGPTATITNGSTPTVSLTNLNIAGVYTFRVTVTADNGDTQYDDVKVTVVASVNQSPVANAGADKTITLPTNSITITGTGTDADGTIASYVWTKVSGPAVGTLPATASLPLTALLAGTYVFQLTVTDDKGATGSDQVTVVVNPAAVNQVPTANAGTDKTVNLPTSTLNITGSGTDADGTIATYAWAKTSGPTVTITNGTSATVSLSALIAGVYIFQLTVTDNLGATATDQVQVTVIAANQSPTANAGSDITITLPTSSTNLTGSGTDPDGSVSSYAWSFVSGPITPPAPTNATTTTATATGLTTAGTYVYRLTVTDNNSSTGFDDVKVIVNAAPVNVPPTANAGTDQSITLPINTITLNGSGTDPDGGSITYAWTKVSGPAASLVNQTTASLTANGLTAGTYVFRLSVKDNQAATTTDDVQVIVQPAVVNKLPVVDAGVDKFLTLPTNSISITATASDPDGSVASYLWNKVSGPGTGTLAGTTTATLDLTNLIAGVYQFQILVTDDKGATNSDAVNVTVTAANIPPVANAGSDITITSPTAIVVVPGSGTDAEGGALTYQWAQVGTTPSVATPANETTVTATFSDLIIGTYTFRLTVTDDKGDTGTDDVKVIVNAPANQAPTANAGIDAIITLPTNSTNFTGVGTDPDGTISTYTWTIVSKPATSTITEAGNFVNASTQTVTVTIDVAGDYIFRLAVTDDIGAADFDDVKLTVNSAVNNPPVANAGANQSITLPLNSLNLTGTGSDPDVGGSIATYAWTKQSGPTVDITNGDKATVSLANLVEGAYTFRLTITDDGGLTAFDEVSVTVLPAAVNQPPTADAGGTQTITLPIDNATLFGSGADPDGGIVVYEWVFISGPSTPAIANPDKASTAVTGMTLAGTYVLRLTVTDDKSATASDDVSIVVNAIATNAPPTANAGSDKTVTLPTSIADLVGTGSDPEGSALTYSWVKVSGPTVTLLTPTSPTLSISALLEGVYIFRLEVKDAASASGTDDVKVTVLPAATNKAPVVVTDADISIFMPNNSVNVTGTASDADGSIKSVLWTKVSGPTIAPADFVNSTTTNLSVTNLVIGTYTFRLTATDDKDATGSDVTKVTVFADTVNQPPTANAGADIITKLASETLNGSGSDPDGVIASYLWSKVSGPACTFTPADAASTTVSGMTQDGIYKFSLTVKDNKGKSSPQDFIEITKFTAINNPPTASAGGDFSIQLPENSATLDGTASDVDATTPVTHWEQVSGPTTAITGSQPDPQSLTNLVEGTYVFRFFAVDANDATLVDSDDLTVTVFAAPVVNNPPTVDAGEIQHLTLPDNSAKLVAVAQTDDGLIDSYKWTLVSGPPQATYTLSSDTTVAFLDVTGITIEGSYVFSVKVTDNEGLTATDETTLEVEAGPYNVFTPNNDNVLETWHIGTPTDFTSCEINVYNRQGLRVYKSLGYDSEWNGTYNGQPVPEGVYFYTIGCPDTKAKTGTVTIIR